MKNILIVILALSMLTSCKLEPVDANIETAVSGRVYDNWNKLPITNFKLRVAEFKNVRAGEGITPVFIQFLDSTYTDVDGSYAMNFKTSGKGNYYRLVYDLPENYSYYQGDYNEIKVGGENEINFDFQKTVTLKARIIVHDNPAPPLAVGTSVNRTYLEKIHGTNNDTIRYMQVSRNSKNKIQFSINENSYNKFYREYIEVGDVDFDDTVEHVFDVYPSKF